MHCLSSKVRSSKEISVTRIRPHIWASYECLPARRAHASPTKLICCCCRHRKGSPKPSQTKCCGVDFISLYQSIAAPSGPVCRGSAACIDIAHSSRVSGRSDCHTWLLFQPRHSCRVDLGTDMRKKGTRGVIFKLSNDDSFTQVRRYPFEHRFNRCGGHQERARWVAVSLRLGNQSHPAAHPRDMAIPR